MKITLVMILDAPPRRRLRNETTPRHNGLTHSMWCALRALARGERPKGVHLPMMAKMGLCERVSKEVTYWPYYVITPAGRDKLQEAP